MDFLHMDLHLYLYLQSISRMFQVNFVEACRIHAFSYQPKLTIFGHSLCIKIKVCSKVAGTFGDTDVYSLSSKRNFDRLP